MHFGYNVISLGMSHGWFAGTSEAWLSVIPNRLVAAALGGLALGFAMLLARRAKRRVTLS